MTAQTTSLDLALHISEQLPLADQLRLIGLLSERVRQQVESPEAPVDMLTLVGLGAELWRQIDVDDYIESERASWNH